MKNKDLLHPTNHRSCVMRLPDFLTHHTEQELGDFGGKHRWSKLQPSLRDEGTTGPHERLPAPAASIKGDVPGQRREGRSEAKTVPRVIRSQA